MDDAASEERLQEILRTLKTVPPAAERLAALGWPLPGALTPAQLDALIELSPAEIDAFLTELYREDAQSHFRWMVSEMLDRRESLRPWHALLRECVDSYMDERFVITVPSLLVILEGLVVGGPGQSGRMHSALNELESRIVRDGLRGGLSLAFLASNRAFLRRVFGGAAFDGPRPEVVNRHWILHGRDEATWDRTDSLRLFVAVSVCSKLLDMCPA